MDPARQGAAPGAPGRRLGRAQRLTEKRLFDETYAQGECWRGRFMVFWRRRGPGAALRLGVVASRKVGGAVQRARCKRRLREAYRLNRSRFSGDCDIVLISRAALLTAPWDALNNELLRLAAAAGLTPRGGAARTAEGANRT